MTTPADTLTGLTEQEALKRLEAGQGNNVQIKTSRSYWQILFENLLTFFNIVLFSLSLIMLLLGSPADAFVTSGVVIVNVIIAVSQEFRAKKKLDEIALLARPTVTIVRDGQEQTRDQDEVVLGDILRIGAGDQVVVDGELVGDGHLSMDESLLTGEPDLIAKTAGDELRSGSFCVVGGGYMRVTRVGADSYANQITENARSFKREYTPLQRDVDTMIRILVGVAFFFWGLLYLRARIHGQDMLDVVQMAAVIAAIAPYSLFLMITVAYGLGALRISTKGALVQQSNSVESLSNVTTLCLDKTGTLTTGNIKFNDIALLNNQTTRADIERILGAFAHNFSDSNQTNNAIAQAFANTAVGSVKAEVPFSSAWKWSAIAFKDDANLTGNYILGAPMILQNHFPAGIDWQTQAAAWMDRGLRVVAFAHDPSGAVLQRPDEAPQLPPTITPLALIGFSDELRPHAAETLASFRETGITIKVISGDNPKTVAALARQLGLTNEAGELVLVSGPELAQKDEAQFIQTAMQTDIFGRITPDQKERLVDTLRKQGEYVAMTGDGVNDVMALKRANLGIAMETGSQATRGVADIVLMKDDFSVLPDAFREGQRIINGIRDMMKIYLPQIMALVLMIVGVSFLMAGFPFTPRQYSVITIIAISIPNYAIALWAKPGVMSTKGVLYNIRHFVFGAGFTLSVGGLVSYLIAALWLVQEGNQNLEEILYYAQSNATIFLTFAGIVLSLFAVPPSKFWVGGSRLVGDSRMRWLAIALFIGFVIWIFTPFLMTLYDISMIRPEHLVTIGVLVVIWTFGTRLLWRKRFFDDFFNIDLGGETIVESLENPTK